MYGIIEYEIDNFKKDFERGLHNDKGNNYLDDSDYEDEFSHNDISKLQYQLKQDIEKFLEDKNISTYEVYVDWCVHVVNTKWFNRH